MSKTLNEEQITYLFAKLEKENAEDEEENAEASGLSASQQTKKWIKRNEKGAKKWIGKLNPEQKGHITQFRGRFEKTGNHWLSYKRSYQQALRELFATADRSSEFEEKLLALILFPDSYRSDELLAASEVNNSVSAEYLIGMLEMADGKQIIRLVDEIDDLAQDIASIHKKL